MHLQAARTRLRRIRIAGFGLYCLSTLVCPAGWGQSAKTPPKDLTTTSIEDLMNVEVTSVSKRQQKLSRVAAAIFVITQEDIRRSGATNIPDLLRMVPGMDVAQINGSTWAIGSRGFNAQFSDKLQVMVDGRSLYSLTFSGVFWDTVDIPLSGIERIEVIRGPGGSVWGANAVTGVISIFTKKASETPGTFIEAGGGTLQQGFGVAQYGGELGKGTDFRIYTKYFNQSHMLGLNGQSGEDGWHRLREGFRTDSKLSAHDSLMVEGDVSTGKEGELGFELPSVTSPAFIAVSRGINLADGSLETIWDHTYSGGSDSSLRFSFDQHRRADPLSPETRNTFDLDFRHHLAAGKRQEIVWGLEYLHTGDEIGGSFTSAVFPAHRANQLFSTFIQDEIALVPQRLYVTVGSKLEHNDFTGFGLMPTVRGSWTPSDRQMFWAAVSKALRTPSRDETGLILNMGSFAGPGGTPILLRLLGNPNFKNESMISYEAGYRTMLSRRLSFDLAAYFNDWDNARTIEPSSFFFESSPPPPHFVQTLLVENLLYGETHGIELQANWRVTDRWSINPGYTFAQEHMHTLPNSRDTRTGPFVEGSAPDNMAQLRSRVELMRRLTWDGSAYFNDHLPNQGPTGNVKIPAYVRLDTGLTWRPWERFSISVEGQNLMKDHHLEFEDLSGSVQSGQVKRSAYAKIAWQF